MSNFESLIIKNENSDPKNAKATLIDDHRAHLKSHLLHLYKPRMWRHVLSHVSLYGAATKLGIPQITLEEVLRAVRKK